MKKISLVIFDLDGTVIDNDEVYQNAYRQVLKTLGKNIDRVDIKGSIGIRENWESLIEKYKINTDKSFDLLSRQTQDIYLSNLDDVSINPGFEEFIDNLRENNVATALATANNWEVVDTVLEKLGIASAFDVTTTIEEVLFTKPDPEIFLFSARKLNIEVDECVVFEDAIAGLKAARAAKMKVVGIASTDEKEIILESADLVVQNYTELDYRKILSL